MKLLWLVQTVQFGIFPGRIHAFDTDQALDAWSGWSICGKSEFGLCSDEEKQLNLSRRCKTCERALASRGRKASSSAR